MWTRTITSPHAITDYGYVSAKVLAKARDYVQCKICIYCPPVVIILMARVIFVFAPAVGSVWFMTLCVGIDNIK